MSSPKTIPLIERHVGMVARAQRQERPVLRLAIRALLLAGIALYPVWFTIHYRAVYDPDIWWHMRAGEWVLQNHTLPQSDFLSIAGAGKPWVLYSWIFDVTVASLYRMCGLLGPIIIYPITMALLIAAALYALAAELGFSFWHSEAVLALSLVALAPICSPRPGLASVLFLTIELLVLARSRRTGSENLIYTLPFLFALWANIHVQFVYGLFVLGLFSVEALAEPALERFLNLPPREKTPLRRTLLLLSLCVLATLFNPYFFRLFEVIIGLASQAGQYRYISELQPPMFRTLGGLAELLLIVLGWGVLVYRRNFRWIPLVFLLAGTTLAFRTVRDVWVGVLAAVFAIGLSVGKANIETSRPRIPFVVAVIFFALAGTVLIGEAHPLSEGELWKDTGDEFPVAAVDYVKKQGFAGPLYNDWNWGGFLIWDLPSIPVYVDSRTNLAGDETLERSIAVWSGVRDWAEDQALSSARLIIANPSNALTSLLRFDPRFRVTYEDGVAVVFVRSGP